VTRSKATAASLVEQYLMRKVVAILFRAFVIIFMPTFTLCLNAVLLGKCEMVSFAESVN